MSRDGEIGTMLKQWYGALVAEPLPPRLADLLSRLSPRGPAGSPGEGRPDQA